MARLLTTLSLLFLFGTGAMCRTVLQVSEGASAPSGEAASTGGCTVVINEIVHKPEDNGEVKGVDLVELYNPCDRAVDLAGWSLTDEDDNLFVMGENGCEHALGPNEYLVLFRNNPCSFEFGYTGVDKATLKDEGGSVVSFVEWGMEDANIGRSWSAIPDGSTTFKDGFPTPGVANQEYVE